MADDLSNDPAHKLHAVMHHEWPDLKKGLPLSYFQACERWYAGLSGSDRVVAILAVAEFAKGDEIEAERIAAALPAARGFPLE